MGPNRVAKYGTGTWTRGLRNLVTCPAKSTHVSTITGRWYSFCGLQKEQINGLIKGFKAKFNITDKGDLKEYLRVLVEKEPDGRLKLSQPHLITHILEDLWLNDKTNVKATVNKYCKGNWRRSRWWRTSTATAQS
jgi:hypothetical protein